MASPRRRLLGSMPRVLFSFASVTVGDHDARWAAFSWFSQRLSGRFSDRRQCPALAAKSAAHVALALKKRVFHRQRNNYSCKERYV